MDELDLAEIRQHYAATGVRSGGKLYERQDRYGRRVLAGQDMRALLAEVDRLTEKLELATARADQSTPQPRADPQHTPCAPGRPCDAHIPGACWYELCCDDCPEYGPDRSSSYVRARTEPGL